MTPKQRIALILLAIAVLFLLATFVERYFSIDMLDLFSRHERVENTGNSIFLRIENPQHQAGVRT